MRDNSESQGRRKEDQTVYKIKNLGIMASAVMAIGALVLGTGSLFWQTKSDAVACEKRIDMAQIQQDMTLVKMQSDIEYIKSGIIEIKAAVKNKE